MFLKCSTRRKDGKEHRSWSIVESHRLGRSVVQRHVLYLGEINDSQRVAWQKAVAVFDEQDGQTRQCVLFPEDRPPPAGDTPAVQVRLDGLQLSRPRTWGACWLGDQLWRELQLDTFFAPRLWRSREGTDWEKVLRLLTLYRLLSPGSEWRLHRHWFGTTALADLLDVDERVAQDDTLYRGLDGLLTHKDALFTHLRGRWSDLFGSKFDVLLYDLTSTYFECDAPGDETDPRRFGYSRDKRSDCVQVIVALVVTPEGLPPAYEMLPGNTADKTTLRDMLKIIQKRYGRAERIWVMDRGVPTEAVLAQLRQSDPKVSYLLRTNLGADDPEWLWRCYTQLVFVEEAFRTLKGDLGLRPIFHHRSDRIEAHLFVAFLAYCLSITLRQRLKALAGGLMPRVAFEKLAALQLLDVRVPTTDGRELLLVRRTEPDRDVALLLARLNLTLPPQPPPRIGPAKTR